MRPRALLQDQYTRQLISAQKTSHEHNNKNKDPISYGKSVYLW